MTFARLFSRIARVALAIAALSVIAAPVGNAQTTKDPLAAGRDAFDDFVKAVAAFPLGDIPYSKPERRDLSGLRVASDTAVMKRFGGPVTFVGQFEAIAIEWDSVQAKPTNRQKIEMELEIPGLPGGPTNWTFHLYPKATAVKTWQALQPKTLVPFRAVVTGVTQNHAFIPGVELRWYSILLEEAEVVQK